MGRVWAQLFMLNVSFLKPFYFLKEKKCWLNISCKFLTISFVYQQHYIDWLRLISYLNTFILYHFHTEDAWLLCMLSYEMSTTKQLDFP